jgi:hypothetical protein
MVSSGLSLLSPGLSRSPTRIVSFVDGKSSTPRSGKPSRQARRFYSRPARRSGTATPGRSPGTRDFPLPMMEIFCCRNRSEYCHPLRRTTCRVLRPSCANVRKQFLAIDGYQRAGAASKSILNAPNVIVCEKVLWQLFEILHHTYVLTFLAVTSNGMFEMATLPQ